MNPLPRDWREELAATTRAEYLEKVQDLVLQSLESYDAGELQKAVRIGSDASKLAPRSGRIREMVGLALYHSGEFDRAAKELLNYRRLTARTDQNHVIADSYRALKRYDRAIEICREVQRHDVSDEVWTEVVSVWASALADKGEVKEAIAIIYSGEVNPKAAKPHHLRLWYVLADLLERSGEKAKAKSYWEKIVRQNPEFYDSAERLG